MSKKRSDEPSASTVPMPEECDVQFLGPDLALLSFPLAVPELPDVLTAAEQEVALRIYAGASNDEIARARGVSLKTVTNQLESIYRKLRVQSRSELVLKLRGKPR